MSSLSPDNIRFNAMSDSRNGMSLGGGGGYNPLSGYVQQGLDYMYQQKLLEQQNQSALSRAALEAQTSRYNTDANAAAQRYGVDAQRYGADLQNQQYGAQLGLDRYKTDTQAGVTQRGNDQSYNLGVTSAANQRYATDLSAQTTQRGQDLQLQAAQMPYQYKQNALSQFGGSINNALSALTSGGTTFNPAAWTQGVAPPPAPSLNAAGAGTAFQRQGQIDRSKNEGTGATRKAAVAADLAGRGYGANSPLLMALTQGIDTGTQQANAASDATNSLGAAQLTAQQQQTAATLGQQGYADYQNAIANASKLGLGYYQQNQQSAASVLAALSGLLG